MLQDWKRDLPEYAIGKWELDQRSDRHYWKLDVYMWTSRLVEWSIILLLPVASGARATAMWKNIVRES